MSRRAVIALLALVSAALLALPACSDDDGGTDPTGGGDGGSTVVVGAEELPEVLNNLSALGGTAWTGFAAGPALARGYRLRPDFTYEPWLFARDCEVTAEEPFTVGCEIRSEAKWSDGTPLTAEDFEFTWQTIMNPDNAVLTTDGYDRIESFEIASPTEFDMVFSEPFAPYRDLWAGSTTTVLPKHVLEGEDFNEVWNECICDPESGEPIGSGPMLVESFTPGEKLTLVRNDEYWADQAKVEQVVFVPTLDSESEITAFQNGEVDVIYPQNALDLRERIESVDGATYQSELGSVWEHLDMLTTVPGLDDVEVRRAIATALPRQQIVDRLVKPANEDAAVLDSAIYMTNQAEYQPNWDVYPAEGDVAAANRILDEAGWVQPPGGGAREKDGVALRFRLGTTAGDAARELLVQVIQERLREIGVETEITNREDILDTDLLAFDYDMIVYAFVGSPDPFVGDATWLSTQVPEPCASIDDCTSTGQNFTRLSLPAVDELLAEAGSTFDAARRAELYNQVDVELATNGVSVVPLFQKPTALAWAAGLSGLADNPTVEGFTWNIEEWERTSG